MWFMKSKAGFSVDEMLNLAPFEYEIFYNMAIKDFKEKMEVRAKEQQRFNNMMLR